MKIFDLAAMCARNLIRRKFRTFLTVMGVVIGTTAIIVMISLGIGIGKSQEEMIKNWGDLTVINVYNYGGQDIYLDDDAIEKIQAIPNVDVATPFVRFMNANDVQAYAGKSYRYKYGNGSYGIVGVYPEALTKLGYTIESGEGFSTGKTKQMEFVIGSMTAYSFEDTKKKVNNRRNGWPDENGVVQEEPFFEPLDAEVMIRLMALESEKSKGVKDLEYTGKIVGVLKGEYNKYSETMDVIYLPLDEMKRIQTEFDKANGIKKSRDAKTSYDDVRVKAVDMESVPDIQAAIKDLGFESWSMETERENAEQSSRQIQMILGGLGAVSLFVSAISITNTMIMSVYERTREIGVMKVLGCLVGNIRTMFLFEAGLIGLVGGVIGIGLSFLLSWVMNTIVPRLIQSGDGGGMLSGMFGMMMNGENAQLSIIPSWLVLLGLIFATSVGLVSGFYPANRAVKISALEAIKQE